MGGPGDILDEFYWGCSFKRACCCRGAILSRSLIAFARGACGAVIIARVVIYLLLCSTNHNISCILINHSTGFYVLTEFL